MPKPKTSKKKLSNKKFLNKKTLLRVGIYLSVLLNVVVVVVVLWAVIDVHEGRIDYLTNGNLQVDTCNHYFSKTNIKSGGSYQVGNVKFTRTYLTPAEQKNYCNSLNNNTEFQYLIQSDNQKALDYFNKTTNFSNPLGNLNSKYKNLIAPPQYQISIPYNAQSQKPVNPQSMGLAY